jgi:hypothetical protein
MRRHITHDARQVGFHVPAHMVDQPIDVCGQLHIALHLDIGLAAIEQRL